MIPLPPGVRPGGFPVPVDAAATAGQACGERRPRETGSAALAIPVAPGGQAADPEPPGRPRRHAMRPAGAESQARRGLQLRKLSGQAGKQDHSRGSFSDKPKSRIVVLGRQRIVPPMRLRGRDNLAAQRPSGGGDPFSSPSSGRRAPGSLSP